MARAPSFAARRDTCRMQEDRTAFSRARRRESPAKNDHRVHVLRRAARRRGVSRMVEIRRDATSSASRARPRFRSRARALDAERWRLGLLRSHRALRRSFFTRARRARRETVRQLPLAQRRRGARGLRRSARGGRDGEAPRDGGVARSRHRVFFSLSASRRNRARENRKRERTRSENRTRGSRSCEARTRRRGRTGRRSERGGAAAHFGGRSLERRKQTEEAECEARARADRFARVDRLARRRKRSRDDRLSAAGETRDAGDARRLCGSARGRKNSSTS